MVATDVAEVLGLLEVEHEDRHCFIGNHPESSGPRVFGGQLVAQAIRAAGHTQSVDRTPHSAHAYFLRPGSPAEPLRYRVTPLRDGATFSVRRVVATQSHGDVLEMLVSSTSVPGEDRFGRAMPEVPAPDQLPPVYRQLQPYADELDGWWVRPRPVELRYVGQPPRAALDNPGPDRTAPENRVWMRAEGPIPDDPILARCLLAYLSDMTLLDPLLRRHGRTSRGPGAVGSLDHAIWFHDDPDLTDWILYDQRAVGGSTRRGLCEGYLHQSDGRLLCTVSQEGFLSPVAPTTDRRTPAHTLESTA
ncbi:thioesterase family protein [Nocardia farcinica]|uniref:acyl-CoA thioesterase n=1 Tax=Nocardia farcinica TaxID=37329 RepID=UPI0015F021FE|nr:acyl-CoA thioesterase domain-containing protein [Nocardia farcinica]MBA4857469.1 thioesterase family protein [Nocardia farcinica]MBC9816232.1 thioesterase family protein [Nocardia farcinica]MBF6262365.1 thioesterase family protein [Nocardia farcinica]MBF6280905.1 thioesterase family protein [Nocardia farcinica]MBF6304639.1 thioesterase family protein [Nocardia farcinica]